MMNHRPPRVSSYVPVRNGKRYLRTCLDSILAQSFGDFDLIICDNASTDGTEATARDDASRDVRIRYVRHATDLGGAENFNSGFKLACGEYYRWQAHDDCIKTDHLQKCIQALEEDPSVVLVYPQARIIDDDGQALEEYDFRIDTDSPSPLRPFHRLIMARNRQHRNFEIFWECACAPDVTWTWDIGCCATGPSWCATCSSPAMPFIAG